MASRQVSTIEKPSDDASKPVEEAVEALDLNSAKSVIPNARYFTITYILDIFNKLFFYLQQVEAYGTKFYHSIRPIDVIVEEFNFNYITYNAIVTPIRAVNTE